MLCLTPILFAKGTNESTIAVPLSEKAYAAGYSHFPMSSQNKVYVFNYNLGVQDYKMSLKDKNWTFLGSLPAHSTDNYNAFYAGESQGDNAYQAAQGHNNTDYYNCPPRHSAEYCLGWKFGWGIPSNFDAS